VHECKDVLLKGPSRRQSFHLGLPQHVRALATGDTVPSDSANLTVEPFYPAVLADILGVLALAALGKLRESWLPLDFFAHGTPLERRIVLPDGKG